MRSDAETFYFLVGGGIFFCMGFLFIGTQLYLAYFRMDEILENLSRSRGVELRRSIMGRDPFSRFFMLISIAGMLTFHKRSRKGGDLDLGDYENFPRQLGGLIRMSYISALFNGVFLCIIVVIGKCMGWLK